VTGIRLDARPELVWPFTIPAVRHVAEHGLRFDHAVTFLVGENGSGKSTIVEAIADVCKIGAYGGKAGTKYASVGMKTPLGEAMRADFTVEGLRLVGGPRRQRKGFFLRAETLFNLAQSLVQSPSRGLGFWEEDLERQSHGEGFFTVFDTMFREPGLYLMDEPEAALSFTSCLRLAALMHHLGRSGAQIVCATHSPLLAATPGADIIELGDHGCRSVAWSQLDLVDHWRRYLADPDAYLRHFIEPGEGRGAPSGASRHLPRQAGEERLAPRQPLNLTRGRTSQATAAPRVHTPVWQATGHPAGPSPGRGRARPG
jgi:predicted ATPase